MPLIQKKHDFFYQIILPNVINQELPWNKYDNKDNEMF